MCPDKQLLSVYYDDELPSPWKEKMEAHLASCDRCRKAVAAYGKLSSLLTAPVSAEGSEALFAAAWTRARERLRSVYDRPKTNRESEVSRRRVFAKRVFSRRITVPLPFAVAAAAVLIFAFAALLTQRDVQRIPETGAVAEGFNLEPEGIGQVNSMADALRFIESNEFFAGPQSSYVIMRLPENKTFYNLGNPQIQNVTAGARKGSGGR
jgi:hypothetical protein